MGDWELSEFGRHLSQGSGIGELMDDLGHALASGGDEIRMLGGGQPAHIPEIEALWREQFEAISKTPSALEHILGNYEPPAGNTEFRASLAELFRREYGWTLGPENIAVTMGGQTAFFFLLNALAGKHPGGRRKNILLPLVPEYIGYADQSVDGPLFRSVRPQIERLGNHEFKYHVDFEALHVTPDDAAICVSRPTNPTGNVLTDEEMAHLAALAAAHHIPLIIDNAYGAPFPGIIFSQATPVWNQNIILTLSLSKLGLPGTRTGIVVARPEVISAVASMTSIAGLANTNLGQALVTPLIKSGELLSISRNVIRPFYQQKSAQALAWIHQYFDDNLSYRIHRSEGALFLWAWFEDLPITSQQLYERLKQRGVLVVPGNYFFFGQGSDDSMHQEPWKHRDECIRINFSMPDAIVEDGIRIIAEEVARAYLG
jgi:valine--pyruvate aminotransferase